MHDVIVVGVPLLAILGGILLNNHALDLVRHELKETKEELRAEITFEIKEIRGEIRKLEANQGFARRDNLPAKRNTSRIRTFLNAHSASTTPKSKLYRNSVN